MGGLIGTLLSALGAIPAIRMDLGPVWFPIALAVTAVPCTWLGALLETRRASPEVEES